MQDILERIKKVEALIVWAKSEWEKNAAEAAKKRILEKYPEIDNANKKVEFTISTSGSWHKKLFHALCRKYWIKPYRYYRQKYTTVMIMVNENFLNEVLWVEYEKYVKILEELVWGITDDIINQIHEEKEETIIRWELN